jgi:hypothetical protein
MESLRRIVLATVSVALGLVSGSSRAAWAAPEVVRKFGLIPSTPEELAAIEFANAPFSAGARLPRAVDLSSNMPPPLDQGSQGSCVAWALAYALKSYQEKVEEGQPFVGPDGRIDARRVFSPGFIYSQVNQGRDGGCKFPDAFKVLQDYGAAPWAEMPYEEAKPFEKPSAAAVAAARRYRIDEWKQLKGIDEKGIKAQLNAGFPVVIGARVDQGFKELRRGAWDAPHGADLGNHAMVVVGYDDALGAFKVINSWGPQWGEGGYGWITYAHFRVVVNEVFVAKDARNDATPAVEPPGPGPAPEPPGPEPVPEPPGPGPAPEPPAPTPPGFEPVPNPVPAFEPLPRPRRPGSFALTRVVHNVVLPNDPTNSPHLVFDGTLEIPAGAGYWDQVVVSFFLDDGRGGKGDPVLAKVPEFSTVYGQAACGTGRYDVPATGLPLTPWRVWIPNVALDIVPGAWEVTESGLRYVSHSIALVAEPVLYVDGFGVATGPLVRFLVVR